MENILTKEITSKRTIKAVLIAVGMGIGFIVFGGIMLLSLYLGDKYIYDIFYTQIFSKPVWYVFLSLTFIITSLLGIWIVFKVKKLKNNNKSFTLIELLVVIAIIGVLSAIVITSMSNAVTKSRIVRLQVFSDTIRAQLSDSLVSWWSFNEGTGTDAKDMWEGNNGTLTNFDFDDDSGWRSGGDCVSGKCLEFDGINDYVNCGNNASLKNMGSAVTVEAWAKYSGYGDDGQSYSVIIGKGTSGTPQPWTFLLENPGNKIRFRVTAGNVDANAQDSIAHELNRWYYFVGTYDGNNIKIYKDGVRVGITPRTGTIAINDVTAKIGTFTGPSYNFNGFLDEVRIYNSAATITQIQSQYLAGLDKLLSNGAISKIEYNQRIKELSKEIVIE